MTDSIEIVKAWRCSETGALYDAQWLEEHDMSIEGMVPVNVAPHTEQSRPAQEPVGWTACDEICAAWFPSIVKKHIASGRLVPTADPQAAEPEPIAKCNCHRCLKERDERLHGIPVAAARMILCPFCGNKRCPHASDHRYQCTGSNAVGQEGSICASSAKAASSEPVQAQAEPTIREQVKERYGMDFPSLERTVHVVAMHEAVSGKVGDGPKRGVVEDVTDLRTAHDEAQAALAAMRPLVTEAISWLQGMNAVNRSSCIDSHIERFREALKPDAGQKWLAERDAQHAEELSTLREALHIQGGK